jgi:acetylornithine/N-succinyldiaminopimelate aminotransferase
MTSVGLAVVDTVCQDGFLAQVRQRADHLARGLQAIVQDHGLGDERGAGLLRALVLPTDTAAQVVAAAQALSPVGLLINAPRQNLLRFMPALTISDDEIDQGLHLLRQALHAAMAARSGGRSAA